MPIVAPLLAVAFAAVGVWLALTVREPVEAQGVLTIFSQPVSSEPLDGEGEVADSPVMAPPAVATSIDDSMPTTTTPDGALVFPAIPAGWVIAGPINGMLTAQDLAMIGVVSNPEDLTDFGFQGASARTASTVDGGQGMMILVIEYDEPATAKSEFGLLHGRALAEGSKTTASYGPGDFTGPTDQGAVVQYRLVGSIEQWHVHVETWGGDDLQAEAAAALGAVEAILAG
jgi:hypothetical protein